MRPKRLHRGCSDTKPIRLCLRRREAADIGVVVCRSFENEDVDIVRKEFIPYHCRLVLGSISDAGNCDSRRIHVVLVRTIANEEMCVASIGSWPGRACNIPLNAGCRRRVMGCRLSRGSAEEADAENRAEREKCLFYVHVFSFGSFC